MPNLTQIPEIGRSNVKKLSKSGINSTRELLIKGLMPAGRRRIAANLGISPSLVLKWICYSDLLRIKGITGEHARLLVTAGIETCDMLADYQSDELYENLESVKKEMKLTRKLPTINQIENWISLAARLHSDIWFEGRHCFE